MCDAATAAVMSANLVVKASRRRPAEALKRFASTVDASRERWRFRAVI